MIEPAEQSRSARFRERRQAKGLCVRCPKRNDRPGRTLCRACAEREQAKSAAWRAAHPGYMAAYGKAHRAGDANPSSVGRAAAGPLTP